MSVRKKREKHLRTENRTGARKRKLKLVLSICVLLMIMLTMGLVGCEVAVDTQTMGYKTFVYGQNVSRLTPDQAAEKINKSFAEKQVSFYEDGECLYTVPLKELGYSIDTKVLQNEFLRVKKEKVKMGTAFRPKQDLKIDFEIVRNDNEFSEALTVNHFETDTERTDSVNAYIEYDDRNKKFVIINEKQGNQIDQNRLLEYTSSCIQKSLKDDFSRNVIPVEMNTNVYKMASVTAASGELTSRLEELNSNIDKFNNTTITYLFGDVSETIDPDTISSWMDISGDKIEIDYDKVRAYIKELADKYDTIYVPRSFQTTGGQTVTLENNEYGFRIDQNAEFEQLCKDLQSGTTIQRAPVYDREGLTRNGTDDLNGNYIEVSLDQQHLWVYKNGGLVTETDIISGLPTEERATHKGAYTIAYKASPFTLSSDMYGYKVPVNYWMPFVDGQGLHDADWQSEFGGDVYKTSGSHGCVNLPPDEAGIIYDAVDSGYPIILY